MAVFFYHGPTSRAVAFEGLLHSGARFAERILGAFPGNSANAPLVHIATDGESYGHHHSFGEMALAYARSRATSDDYNRMGRQRCVLKAVAAQHDVRVK